jgi:hypothetical protein
MFKILSGLFVVTQQASTVKQAAKKIIQTLNIQDLSLLAAPLHQAL